MFHLVFRNIASFLVFTVGVLFVLQKDWILEVLQFGHWNLRLLWSLLLLRSLSLYSTSSSSSSLSSSFSLSSLWGRCPWCPRENPMSLSSFRAEIPYHCCCPCCSCRPCCCPPPHPTPPPYRHHHHEVDALDVLDVLAKTPGLYLVPELRYPYHCSCSCCCHHPCRCPPPHCHNFHPKNKTTIFPSIFEIKCSLFFI